MSNCFSEEKVYSVTKDYSKNVGADANFGHFSPEGIRSFNTRVENGLAFGEFCNPSLTMLSPEMRMARVSTIETSRIAIKIIGASYDPESQKFVIHFKPFGPMAQYARELMENERGTLAVRAVSLTNEKDASKNVLVTFDVTDISQIATPDDLPF